MKPAPTTNTLVTSEDFFKRLIKESPFIPGDSGELLEGNKIEWLNPKLLKDGQEFFQRNSFSINLAHIAALLFGFSFKNLTTILLRTGKFSGVSNSMTRYVETEMHILNWYESDILAQKDEGFKDIQRVRKMHALALRNSLQSPVKLFENIPDVSKKEELINAMKKDLECFATSEAPLELITYHPAVLMSQFDMAMTQYGFVGLIYLFPDILGIKDTRGLDGFVHFWAVVGRLIGIHDRFNLALHADKKLFVTIFKTVGMSSLRETDLTAVVLQESLSQAICKLIGFTSLRSSLYFALIGAKTLLPAFSGKNIYKTMDWRDLFYLRLLQLILYLTYHSDLIRVCINKVMTVVVKVNRRNILGVKGKYGKINMAKKKLYNFNEIA